MKSTKQIAVAPCIAMILALALASAAPEPSSKFAGVWKAEHSGKTFLIVTLKDGEPLSGSIATGQIQADESGQITEVEEEARTETPLLKLAQKGDVLSFSSKDGDDLMRYEMRLVRPAEAELRILEAPIKPVTLRRQ